MFGRGRTDLKSSCWSQDFTFTESGVARAIEAYFSEFSLRFVLRFLVIVKTVPKNWLLLADLVFERIGLLGTQHLLVMALRGCRCLILKLLNDSRKHLSFLA